MSKKLVNASKFMSLVLRHKPDEIGIVLDSSGWVSIAELTDKSNGMLTTELVRNVVATSEKKRFAISSDGLLIRANQGHSVSVDLGLEERTPPKILFHGTATRFLEGIKNKGLLAGQRQHVHLSDNTETADKVGSHHGKPVILGVKAAEMNVDGLKFYLSENGVWLTPAVPVQYIQFSS